MDMGGFPTSVERDHAGLAGRGHRARPSRRVDIEQIGAGIGVSSALYRVQLTGSGLPEDGGREAARPRRGAVFTSTVLRMYLREAAFFSELAEPGARSGAGVPPLHRRPRDEPVRRW